MSTIGQTSYSTSMTLAVAGMLADLYQDYDIVSYLCSVNIPFGSACEIDLTTDTNGNVIRLPVSTSTTLGAIVGVAMYVDTLEQQLPGTTNVGHAAGTVVPVVRKGRIYARFAAFSTLTVPVPLTTPNIYHPSDNTHTFAGAAGCFTNDNTSTTAGEEVAAGPTGIRFVRPTGLELASSFAGICLLDLNLPSGST